MSRPTGARPDISSEPANATAPFARVAAFHSHPRVEYEYLTHAAGVIDLPGTGVLRLTGADRARFLNAMVTHEVAALALNNARAALTTTTKGKIVAQLLVIAREEELLAAVLQGPADRVAESLESHIIADDVELADVTADHRVIAVEGPKCRELVWRIFPRQPLPLKPGEVTANEYQGMRALVVRHSLAGDKGMLVVTPAADHARMLDFLVQGGIGIDCGPAGRIAWNARRIENGLPWFGADVTADNFPKETRLDDHVSYEKGCYLGQETIARMHYRGHPNWQLVGLAPAGDATALPAYPGHWSDVAALAARAEAAADVRTAESVSACVGVELFAAGEKSKSVGRITSATLSPALEQPLFLAMVRASAAEPGTRLEGALAGGTAALTVVALPVSRDAGS